MEKLVSELRKSVDFKDTTVVGDLVLVAFGEPDMLIYALVTAIERDTSRRDEWWNVTMQLLAVPPRKTTWTLRKNQFTGMEIFTMGGVQHFVQAVRLEADSPDPLITKKRKVKHEKKGGQPFCIVK